MDMPHMPPRTGTLLRRRNQVSLLSRAMFRDLSSHLAAVIRDLRQLLMLETFRDK